MIQTKFGSTPHEGKRHRFYVLVEGCLPIRTHASHSNRTTLGDDLYNSIAQELHVRTGFCKGMMGCSKSRADYLTKSELILTLLSRTRRSP